MTLKTKSLIAGGALIAVTVSILAMRPKATDARDLRSADARLLQATDTAVTRLHISGMTCGTCPATARIALKKLDGVFSATVTYQDSLGVVRYDPKRLTPPQIAAHLTRLTGYAARVLPDSAAKSQA